MLNKVFFTSYPFNYSTEKLRPLYCYKLTKYPKKNPMLIATDQHSLHFVRYLKGTCLFCPKRVDDYDFDFSFQREVWVLYSQKLFSTKAVQLAQAIQQSGASKILAIWINATLSKGHSHEQR